MFLARDGGGLPAFYGLSLQPQPLSPSPVAFPAELQHSLVALRVLPHSLPVALVRLLATPIAGRRPRE